jgi:hypothetical protein
VAELAFVLALATVAIGVAIALARGTTLRPIDWRLTIVALATLLVGAAMIRFSGSATTELRARGLAAIAAFVFGLGNALFSAALHQRIAAPTSLRAGASASVIPLAAAAGGAAAVLSLAARPDAVPTMMFAWAVGSVIGALLSGAGDGFSIVALVTASATVACTQVVARNLAILHDVGPRASALIALAPLLTVLSSVAVFVGAMSVRADTEDSPDTALLRGFVVASITGTLSAIAASHWWARPPGHGAWLALSAVLASIGSLVVLLVGRYYDDPLFRAARAVARAQRGGPRTRLRTGMRFGAESAAIVLSIAVGIALSARRVGESLGLELAGALGMVVAVTASLPTRAYLDAIATSSGAGEGRTLAHDLFIIALATVLLVPLYANVAIAAVLVAMFLTGAAIVERVAAAHGDDGELRRRAAVLPMIAGGVLAASALLEAVLRT